MSLYTQPNMTGGFDTLIVSTAQAVPFFPIMILVFVFGIVAIGGYANQKRKTGWGDFWQWAMLGSIAQWFVALIFTLTKGIISPTTLGIDTAIMFLCAIAFLMSKGKGEV